MHMVKTDQTAQMILNGFIMQQLIHMYSKMSLGFPAGSNTNRQETLWLSGRASDSGARGGVNPHSGRRVVS